MYIKIEGLWYGSCTSKTNHLKHRRESKKCFINVKEKIIGLESLLKAKKPCLRLSLLLKINPKTRELPFSSLHLCLPCLYHVTLLKLSTKKFKSIGKANFPSILWETVVNSGKFVPIYTSSCDSIVFNTWWRHKWYNVMWRTLESTQKRF